MSTPLKVSEQVRVYLVLPAPLAQVRAQANAGDSHFVHVALNRFTVDNKTLPAELGSNAP